MLTPPRPGDAGDSDEEGDASVKDAKEGPTLRLQVRECIQVITEETTYANRMFFYNA